jgi:hypothetical protein
MPYSLLPVSVRLKSAGNVRKPELCGGNPLLPQNQPIGSEDSISSVDFESGLLKLGSP